MRGNYSMIYSLVLAVTGHFTSYCIVRIVMAGSFLAKGLTKALNNWAMLSATKLRPRADKVDCKAIGSLSVTNGYGIKVFLRITM